MPCLFTKITKNERDAEFQDFYALYRVVSYGQVRHSLVEISPENFQQEKRRAPLYGLLREAFPVEMTWRARWRETRLVSVRILLTCRLLPEDAALAEFVATHEYFTSYDLAQLLLTPQFGLSAALGAILDQCASLQEFLTRRQECLADLDGQLPSWLFLKQLLSLEARIIGGT